MEKIKRDIPRENRKFSGTQSSEFLRNSRRRNTIYDIRNKLLLKATALVVIAAFLMTTVFRELAWAFPSEPDSSLRATAVRKEWVAGELEKELQEYPEARLSRLDSFESSGGIKGKESAQIEPELLEKINRFEERKRRKFQTEEAESELKQKELEAFVERRKKQLGIEQVDIKTELIKLSPTRRGQVFGDIKINKAKIQINRRLSMVESKRTISHELGHIKFKIEHPFVVPFSLA
ncbi:MAG: hypothetical protein U9Q24_04950 [Candidatus Ratteibacteria bacterium]|nr:hypothetical protein [Candidatus Ratteibacteria bacterium]